MSGLFQILEVARRALMSQRLGITVTSHNIANASTPGFSRQRVDFAASPARPTPIGHLGTGVIAQRVGRIRERFIDQQVRSTQFSLGEASVRHRVLSQIEGILSEPSSSGLSTVMGRFFGTFQDLALHPEDSAPRNGVLQQGILLTKTFHGISLGLRELRRDLFDDAKLKVQTINQLTQEISRLDLEITSASGVGYDPSDLRDERDRRLEELSKLVNISVFEDNRGSVIVAAGGTILSSRGGVTRLETLIVGNEIRVISAMSGKTVDITSGDLGGILAMANKDTLNYLQKLDEIAFALIDAVNSLHRTGYGLGNPPPTGVDFFLGNNAGNIEVNPLVASNVFNIAASTDGSPGSNEIALAIADLLEEKILEGGMFSIAQVYRGVVSQTGQAIVGADNTLRSQELILEQLENQRGSVSGVSLDEEMTNLIRFQRSFDAAAKVVNTVNDMFQTILNLV